MKASERRLLMVFVTLAVIMGAVLGGQRILGWQHRIERREREAELKEMEASALMAEAPVWMAKDEWITQAQPVAESESQANGDLLDYLRNTAGSAGLTISKTQIEQTVETDYFRQFGVSLLVSGDLPVVMRWVHGLLAPEAFYVVPQLRIIPDKEDPQKVSAMVRVWRWYRPEFGPPKEVGA